MNKPLLTLCMIVKNEEKNLATCLQSVQGIAEQIVVVDTGSTDTTKNLARQFTPYIYDFKWQDDFSAARNFALEQAQGEWILHLDGDEEIEPASGKLIRTILSGSKAEALLVKIRNFHPSADSVRFLDSEQVRLFRNRSVYRYENRIHEQVTSSVLRHKGRMEVTDLLILHHGYQTDARHKAKRNIRLLDRELCSEPNNPYLLFKRGESYKAFGRFAEAEQSFLKVLENPQIGLKDNLLATLYLRLAQIVLQRNEFRRAVTYAEHSLALDRKNIAAHYVRSVASLYLQQLKSARDSLLAIEKSDSKHILKSSDLMRLQTVLTHLEDHRETAQL